MKKHASSWNSFVSDELSNFKSKINTFSRVKKLVVIALLSIFAALFQSAGIVPGVGYLISFLATAPIVIMVILSIGHGLLGYILTILLLLIIQPSELIIFPLTTGLLGLGIGIGLLVFQKRLTTIAFSAFCLCIGISAILYLFRFPVLGPMVETSFSVQIVLIIYLISLIYCWFWIGFSKAIIRKLEKIL